MSNFSRGRPAGNSAEHQISADIQVIDIADVNDAFDSMVDNDVRFRFVIDNATLEALR